MTRLHELLVGDAPRRRSPLDAFELAQRAFLAGESVDMARLAEQIGVSRTTLYRWVGSRNRLLTEVMWAFTQASFDRHRTGPHRTHPATADLLGGLVRDVLRSPGVRSFFEDGPDVAVRRLTGIGSVYHARLLAAVRALIAGDVRAGAITVDVHPDDLAPTAVEVVLAHVRGRVPGAAPDSAGAERVLRTLLR